MLLRKLMKKVQGVKATSKYIEPTHGRFDPPSSPFNLTQNSCIFNFIIFTVHM